MSDGQAERRFPRWTIAFLMVVAVSLHMSGGAVADRGAVDPGILSGFQELRNYVQNAPGQTLPRGLKTSLMRKLDSAEAAYLRGQPCTSANILGAYLNEARALTRGERAALAQDLYERGLLLLSDLLASLPEGERCAHQPKAEYLCSEAPWPELAPVSLTTDPEQTVPQSGLTVTLTVANRGRVAAQSVPVAFLSDGQEFARVAVADVPACAGAMLDVWWPGGELGPHEIEARVDPDNAVLEGMEANNSIERTVYVAFELVRPWERPNVVLRGVDFSPERPVAGELLTLRATVGNAGNTALANVSVRFSVDGEPVDRGAIPELVPGEEATVTGSWASATPGRHYLAVAAELPPEVAERNSTDNVATAIVHVGGESVPLPDLLVEEITVTQQGTDRRVVTFVQVFGDDRVRKELTLVREGQNWRIVSERTTEVL